MSDAEILDGITAVARQHLRYEGPVAPDTRIVDAMQLDSVRLVTLLVEVEDRFGITIEEGDEAEILTIADLVAVIRRRIDG